MTLQRRDEVGRAPPPDLCGFLTVCGLRWTEVISSRCGPAWAHSLLFLAFPSSQAPGVQAALPGLGGVGRGALWLREKTLVHSEKERGPRSTLDIQEEQWPHSIRQLVPRGHALPSSRALDC